jgi:hypothetical protein
MRRKRRELVIKLAASTRRLANRFGLPGSRLRPKERVNWRHDFWHLNQFRPLEIGDLQ